MDLTNRTVLILGGAGLVGRAVARRVLTREPARLVIASLRREETEAALQDLKPEAGDTELSGVWGDLFVRADQMQLPRSQVLQDPERRAALVDDLYGELTPEVFERSALGRTLMDTRPDAIVDCINTAGALAYQNAFASAAELRASAALGAADTEAVERHLATLYLPQLIRHAQLALQGMRRVGTRVYVKVGTAGTGGMGLNIPFTHSEERPSRMLLAKSSIAGAHTLLLYLMARTPGAPAVKEVKPTAAISWKSIGFGPIRRGSSVVSRVDCPEPLPVGAAFEAGADRVCVDTGTPLEGVYLDAGENGLFSLPEFETLTSLGLMEFVTPEEIADSVLREIQAHPTGRDVVAALDASTLGPTYRAGVLRAAALQHMERLEREHGVEAVAYEMLGPPRLTKLLFESAVLARVCEDMDEASGLDVAEAARASECVVLEDADLRQRILSVGIPILLADGVRVLRGPLVAVPPETSEAGLDERAVTRGWVDLRPTNWSLWRDRVRAIQAEAAARPGVDQGSVADHDPHASITEIRPGQLAAWVLRAEEQGGRIKR